MSSRPRPHGLDRRALMLAGASSATAAALSPIASVAAPSRLLSSAAGELTVISDGHLVLPASFLAPDAPPAERDAALNGPGYAGSQFMAPTNCVLIAARSELILVDAGSGPHFMPTAGKLIENLNAAGFRPPAVTKIVFTHGHPDHLWGLIDDLDELAFPNASYVVAAPEWDFWMSDDAERGLPAERAGFVTGARRNYARLKDKVQMVKPGDDIVTGIRVLETHGHTQGHVSLEIAGGEGLIIGGDVLTHPVISFQHPEWRTTADHETERAIATRKKLLDRLATDRTRLIGFHLPYPGIGVVERKDGAYRFVAI